MLRLFKPRPSMPPASQETVVSATPHPEQAAPAAAPAYQLRRSHRWSWMVSGWTMTTEFGPEQGGTSVMTLGVPDDFLAVRVGFPNIAPSPFRVSRVIAAASATYGDYVNPRTPDGEMRGDEAWVNLTFANRGADDDRIATAADAPTEIVVAGNSVDPTTGETANPSWTFTDWMPLASIGADPATGMRVLMLRALIPSGQTVTFTNNNLRFGWTGVTPAHHGYDVFIGGIKFNFDRVTRPSQSHTEDTQVYWDNALSTGCHLPLVQVLTRHAGILGVTTGDSHHAGTATSPNGLNNYLVQSLLPQGRSLSGRIPVGLVNLASGGFTSQQFFPRLANLLPALQPSFVVLPGWTFNDVLQGERAGAFATQVLLARLLSSADRVRDAGAVPIFLTPFPRDAASMMPEHVGPWQALRHAILSLRDDGALVIDATALLGNRADGAYDGTYDPVGGLSTDDVHPNEKGHALIAAELTRLLTPMIG